VKIIARADASVAGVEAACAYACGPVGKGQGTNKKQVPERQRLFLGLDLHFALRDSHKEITASFVNLVQSNLTVNVVLFPAGDCLILPSF
jgi:hypothetical protein